ncbi:MAG: YicC/YloC family endoribonuclease [Paracoccaceae bacterium]
MVNSTVSMTGFASRRGEGEGRSWTWDIRSVNGKGLDLRLRLPEGVEGLEAGARAAVGKAVQRGSVTLSLRIARTAGAEALRVSPGGLAAALAALRAVEQAAFDHDLSLTPATAGEVLGLRGVTDQSGEVADDPDLTAMLLGDLDALVADFVAVRRAEGETLGKVMLAQIARIEALTAEAGKAAEARRPVAEKALRENLARVLAGAAEADPQRVAQELALLAVKADVTEEIDRLKAHAGQARGLIGQGGAVGRKIDFLMQEFMREANTLCSKSGDVALTRIGLDLKLVVDQLREQVQNVE